MWHSGRGVVVCSGPWNCEFGRNHPTPAMTASSVIWTPESLQRRDHRKRAVAGEAERRQASPARLTSASGRTDLQRVLCPDEPDEKGEERCLLRAICICAIGIGAVTLRS